MTIAHAQVIRVWDLPTRIFHWGTVLLVTGLFLTAYTGRMAAHAVFGQAAMVLVSARLVWGMLGSDTARFSAFVRGPKAMLAYLRAGQPRTLGHNPLGGAMIVALLTLLMAQASTGLMANDGISFQGPLAHAVSRVTSDLMTDVHGLIAGVLLGAVAIHVSAVLLQGLLKRDNLITPMWTGWSRWPAGTIAPHIRGLRPWLATLLVMTALLRLAVMAS